MASMVVGNMPDDIPDRLDEKDRLAGKSTEELARETLAEKAKPAREELIRRMDEIRARSKPVSGQAILDEIRNDRDDNLGRKHFGSDE